MFPDEKLIMHPRPSPVAAAMYTMRDLDVDVVVLHGPSGCSFRASRLLERDGVKVVTTSMVEQDFIFGAEKKLSQVLKKVESIFHPKLVGVVGTCASMIIGENLERAVSEAGITANVITANVHCGYGDNTVGAIVVLQSALKAGIIDQNEFERQKKMLAMATDLEKSRGTARREYMETESGDEIVAVARKLLKRMENGEKVAAVLNAKKETAYLFADILLALNEVGGDVINIANLDTEVGLPRIRRYSKDITAELSSKGIQVHHITGGLDEYPLSGLNAAKILSNMEDLDLVVIAGLPHAVPVEGLFETIAVTVGTRAVASLKDLGYKYVIADLDAHSLTLGNRKIVPSKFGETLRCLRNKK